MRLPARRCMPAGLPGAVFAVLVALAPPADALEAVSSDGRYRIVTDDATLELIVRSGDGARELRRIPLRDRDRRTGRLAWILVLPGRESFLAGFESLPEAWELPYGANAEPVFEGFVHDYRMGEGIPEPGPLPVRRIPLKAPLPRPGLDENSYEVSWRDPADPRRLNVLNLDARRTYVKTVAP